MNRPLTVCAWLNVVLHVAGLAFAAVGIAPGTPLVSLHERLEYLSEAPLGWTCGWACWILCAVALIAFLTMTVRYAGARSDMLVCGWVLAIVGAAFDFFCDSVYIVVFPMLAAWRPPPEQLFLTVEKITAIGSLVVANGAYSVAVVMISAGLRAGGALNATGMRLGIGVGLSGLALAAAAFTGSTQHAILASLPTFGLFCVWVLAVTGAVNNRRAA